MSFTRKSDALACDPLPSYEARTRSPGWRLLAEPRLPLTKSSVLASSISERMRPFSVLIATVCPFTPMMFPITQA